MAAGLLLAHGSTMAMALTPDMYESTNGQGSALAADRCRH